MKNNRSRVVPIHEHLIEQGFLEFVGKLGAGPMFYRGAKEDNVGDPLNVKKPRYTQHGAVGHPQQWPGLQTTRDTQPRVVFVSARRSVSMARSI